MIEIKTKRDIQRAREEKRLRPAVEEYLREYFGMLYENLSEPEETVDEFSLEEHGYLVLLEPGDDPRKVEKTGLRRENGLIGSEVDLAERIALKDGTAIYLLGVVFNNEYMMIYILDEDAGMDSETLNWVRENVEERI